MPTERVELLEEAVWIERAGGVWLQRHVSAVTGYSVRYVRASDCPKRFEEGNGPTGKPRVVYVPAEVREWMQRRLRKAS